MKLLHDCDLKVTSARVAVLEILEKEQKPLDAERLHSRLNKQGLKKDQVTVYRILDTFVKKGLIKRLDFQEGKFRYEILTDQEHHHLICESCGTVSDIVDCPVESVELTIGKRQKFLVKRHSLEFFGTCRVCINTSN